MQVVTIREPGDETVLELRDRPDPAVPAHHVRVRVAYAGVNRADLLQRLGLYPAPAGAPADVPGLEYAGLVDEVGEGVTTLVPGERVFGIVSGGAYAELVVVHEREAVRIPDGVPDDVAAAAPEAFLTAYDALVTQAGLEPGQRVLVHAVGSGVGTAAVQVARAMGCLVAGTSRTEAKVERARSLGLQIGASAEDPRDFCASLRQAVPEGFDVILDLVGGPYLAADLDLVAPRGRIVVVGLTGGARAELDLGKLLRKRASVIGTVLRTRPLEEKLLVADVLRRTIAPWISRGEVRPVVDRTFSLSETGEAHRYLATNESFGKVLLRVR